MVEVQKAGLSSSHDCFYSLTCGQRLHTLFAWLWDVFHCVTLTLLNNLPSEAVLKIYRCNFVGSFIFCLIS